MTIFTNDDDVVSMEKFNHLILAEDSISQYIYQLEKSSGFPLPEEDKLWLYKKGKELFDLYYINDRLEITVMSENDDQILSKYLEKFQDHLSKMYAHILVTEFKVYLLEKSLKGSN